MPAGTFAERHCGGTSQQCHRPHANMKNQYRRKSHASALLGGLYAGRFPRVPFFFVGQSSHKGLFLAGQSSDVATVRHSESDFIYFLGLSFRRFPAGGVGAALRVTNLWAMPSKSRNTSRLTRDRRTSTT